MACGGLLHRLRTTSTVTCARPTTAALDACFVTRVDLAPRRDVPTTMLSRVLAVALIVDCAPLPRSHVVSTTSGTPGSAAGEEPHQPRSPLCRHLFITFIPTITLHRPLLTCPVFPLRLQGLPPIPLLLAVRTSPTYAPPALHIVLRPRTPHRPLLHHSHVLLPPFVPSTLIVTLCNTSGTSRYSPRAPPHTPPPQSCQHPLSTSPLDLVRVPLQPLACPAPVPTAGTSLCVLCRPLIVTHAANVSTSCSPPRPLSP